MKITLVKELHDVPFAVVAKAMDNGMHNISSIDLGRFGRIVKERYGDQPWIAIATHSMGGRTFGLFNGRTPLWFPDETFDAGWHVLTEDDATFVEVESASSGSNIYAARDTISKQWYLRLTVPVVDDVPYQGCYWQAFHAAVSELLVNSKEIAR